jgi:hypothetical protein
MWDFMVVSRIVLYLLAAIASGVAAARFGWWREHIGRAWTLFSLEFVCLLINYILRRTASGASVALEATLIAANLAQIIACWLMARVLTSAGIGYMISPVKRTLLTLAALAVAVLLCHDSLLNQWNSLAAGQLHPGSLISTLADVITFTLVAPLAISAFTLRGGQLSWIFGFLTVSVFGWMVNTGAESIASPFGGSAVALRDIRLAGIAIATLFNAAAAAAQVLASTRAMRGARTA